MIWSKKIVHVLLIGFLGLFVPANLLAQQINLSVTTTSGNVRCAGGSDGVISATADGGAPPYSYLWSNGNTNALVTNVPAGTYSVVVTDQLGNTASGSTTVFEPAPFVIELQPAYETCAGSQDGKVDVRFVSAGTPPYRYNWSNGSTNYQLLNVSAGPYSVTVTDVNGCEATASGELELSPEGVWVMTSHTDASCGQANGTAYAAAMTGTAPFSFLWSNGATVNDPAGLSPGKYYVTVTDANGCFNVDSVTVASTNGSLLDIELVPTYETCTGSQDGKIDVQINTPGTPPYTYMWSNGNTNYQLLNVSAGFYSVTVTDATGCEGIASGELELSPEGIWVMTSHTDTDCGLSNGTAYANAMTGTPPYSYLWSNGATVNNPSGLAAGKYYVTVSDVNGCSTIDSVSINGSNPADAGQIFSNDPLSFCIEDGLADIVNITSAGNQATQLSFLLTDSNGEIINPNIGNSIDFEGTGAGTVQIWAVGFEGTISGLAAGQNINDLSGCFDLAGPIVVQKETCTNPDPCTQPVIRGVVLVEANCDQADGRATIEVEAIPLPFLFDWSNGSMEASATGLMAGVYSVTISDPLDPAACNVVEEFTLGNANGPRVTIVQTTPATCMESNGTATLSPIGLEYKWCNGAIGNNVTNLSSGACFVTVTDPVTRCQNFITVQIDEINPLLAEAQINQLLIAIKPMELLAL